MTPSTPRANSFKKILVRNVALPLVLSISLSAIFITLIFYMISVSRWVDHTDQVMGKATEILKLTVDSETGIRGFLLTGKDNFLEPYDKAGPKLAPDFEQLKNLVSDNPSQVERAAQIRDLIARWNDFANDQINLKREGKYQPGQNAENGKAQMDGIRAEFQTFVDLEQNLRNERSESTQTTIRWTLLVVILFSVISGSIIAFAGRKQLIELSGEYEDVLENQAVQNNALQEHAWLQSASAGLSDKLRGELPTLFIAEIILDYLVPYAGATLGSLYLRQPSGTFERIASHGASKDEFGKNSKNSFELREGILGQAASGKKLVNLTDLPEDYVKVESSLGNTPLRELIIAPLLANGETNAVIELGFLKHPEPRVTELLQRLSESLGVSFKSALYRVRLQELLEQSQQLNEELQTQQEELRTSNEELSEQTKALQEAQARLESQHAEMEQTNQQLEEQARLLEHQKDNLDTQNIVLQGARESVEQKARELERANRFKSEFLANMSHELRTPLNSTLILAKLLKENSGGNLTAEQVEFASTIYSAGNDLLDLINDILDLSKVEAGKLDLQNELLPVTQLTKSLQSTFGPIAKDKKIDFRVQMDAQAPHLVETDRQRIEQILKNLLSNAFKFTKQGSVTLAVRPSQGGKIAFSVIDTGSGIDPSQSEVIFEAFRQADGTITRNYGGTGLGLTISRNLAHLLGGVITLKSALGEGSEFTLTIPERVAAPQSNSHPQSHLDLAIPKPTQPPVSVASPHLPTAQAPLGPSLLADDRDRLAGSQRRRLLVVEDELAFAKILFELAHELEFDCLVAGNSADGYALANHHLPHAIILDMKLPDGSGLALLNRLKENTQTRHIPVHAISAADYSHEALRLGAVGYVLKPADRDQLKITFKRLEEKISQQIKRVLIVEDDQTQRESIKKLIEGKGVEIVMTGLAEQALEYLSQSTFDCVIVDLKLPDMSGFDLLQRMAHDEKISFPPVIVYTGKSLTKAEEETLRKYSKTIIIKGARSPERLLDEVTLFLHQIEAQLSPERRQMLKTSRNRENAFEGRTVLLVDDDVRNIFALRSTLQQKGAKTVVARNGQESLDQLKANPEVDLVLMDIMMPVMDGYQAMREIKKNPAFAKLPIIAVTAKAMRDDYEKCLEAGASDYLAKPIDIDKLVSLMRVWLPEPIGKT